MRFADIIGFDDVKSALLQAIQQGHVAHAQLFAGNEGSPNLALALAYATYLNCEDRQPDDSCGRCPSCVKFNHLVHPDLHFVFPSATLKGVEKDRQAAEITKRWREFAKTHLYDCLSDWSEFIGSDNRQPNISVEESRNIVRSLSLKAFEAEYKILLMWLPECMNIQSANAILKILEEPPAKTLFLLVSHNPEKLLITILSRTQMVRIRPFEMDELVAYLVQHQWCDETKAQLVAPLAEGNLSKALQLSQEKSNNYHAMVTQWLRLCYGRKFQELVDYTEEFQKLGREAQKSFLHYGLALLREVFIQQLAAEGLQRVGGEALDFAQKFSRTLGPSETEQVSKWLNEAYYHIERNANPKIVMLDTSLQISHLMFQARQENKESV
ncbi:DNA polymerase-3 subunit delta' [Catalinimonas alkaloidigena]|uniref:DNA polymerase-3 subunit delta n=1 Tax=Catalinimonas alkaloidigena TaxID=1075417 RepID=A0A1G9N4B2_9BACT|nr:DNA polymerase III subunit delta' [Catalinimonas alkaloidigena]SDL81234.1 DNA polymerase-3 subunit delta' [Catalinimonas alkaloidigena]